MYFMTEILASIVRFLTGVYATMELVEISTRPWPFFMAFFDCGCLPISMFVRGLLFCFQKDAKTIACYFIKIGRK
jgi:hypothetical protein